MSRNNETDVDPLPDEPPPPYEPLAHETANQAASTTASSTAPSASTAAASAATSTNATTNTNLNASHNPFLAPEEHTAGTANTVTATSSSPNPSSSTNPFLSTVTPQQTGTSTVSTAAAASASQAPSLPPRTYATPSPAPSQPEPTRPSIDSRHSRHSSVVSPVSPAPASPSVYAPPSGPPPISASASNRPNARHNDQYRPTTVPTPGQPLLRKRKLLVYPRDWRGCPKCHDTGYKHGDPNNPHKSCWDKYGKTYTSAMSYSAGLNGATDKFQRPLPVLSGPSPQGMAGPSHGYVPGGYPGAGVGAALPPEQGYGHGGFRPPLHAPPPPMAMPPRTATSPVVDAETEGSRMSDVPPNYQDASNVTSEERLPSQYVPPPQPPPGHGPPPPPPRPHAHPGPSPYGCAPPPPPGGFVGGFGPNPGGPNPYVSVQPQQAWYGARPPPPGALVVMPGDPRIGGRLCFECGGRGLTESFWFGDETCLRCRGSGRIF
ncbi:uncharacterized protein UTRI_10492 [Ustilago trichophora]|uniref:Proline-rich protein HUA1 n=1 Tax=Ustilago trichophora TaxID=86804 RepID=A0A5C3EBH1_9BASI|nr:uncharacterized protein UTRI_10492 [Ustilago trichophora]